MDAQHTTKSKLKTTGLFVLEVIYNVIIIIVLVILLRSYLISPFRVVGWSMDSTLHDQEFILINKLSYHLSDIERGDPIVFLPPTLSTSNPKFKEKVTTNEAGMAQLELSNLTPQVEWERDYCRNQFLKKLWLCDVEARADDVIYFAPQYPMQASSNPQANWKEVQKIQLNKTDVKKGYVELETTHPDTSFTLRIYSPTEPEHFVKRVIGLPGDTIKIENGLVYLQKESQGEFIEIEEPYLNKDNTGDTSLLQAQFGNTFTVPEGNYFVLGDNRNNSTDSRGWLEPVTQEFIPFLPEENIKGKVMMVLWPLNELKLIPGAEY